MSLSRRYFGQQTLGALLTYSLLETLCTRELFAADMKLLAAKNQGSFKDIRPGMQSFGF